MQLGGPGTPTPPSRGVAVPNATHPSPPLGRRANRTNRRTDHRGLKPTDRTNKRTERLHFLSVACTSMCLRDPPILVIKLWLVSSPPAPCAAQRLRFPQPASSVGRHDRRSPLTVACTSMCPRDPLILLILSSVHRLHGVPHCTLGAVTDRAHRSTTSDVRITAVSTLSPIHALTHLRRVAASESVSPRALRSAPCGLPSSTAGVGHPWYPTPRSHPR